MLCLTHKTQPIGCNQLLFATDSFRRYTFLSRTLQKCRNQNERRRTIFKPLPAANLLANVLFCFLLNFRIKVETMNRAVLTDAAEGIIDYWSLKTGSN